LGLIIDPALKDRAIDIFIINFLELFRLKTSYNIFWRFGIFISLAHDEK
jgi:hypothetical protein